MQKFITYKRFIETEQVEEIVEILKENNIPYEIEDNTRQAPDIIIGMDTAPKILLKLYPDDFLKANELLSLIADNDLENVDKDYHLFSFENDELLEIITEPDTWCEFDVQLSKKILNDRGIVISSSLEKVMKEKRIKELSKKEDGSSIWTVFGYISAFLGGILGIAIGLSLWKSKRTLPNGERIYVYKDSDRFHGFIITLIGIVMFVFFVALRIFY
ncbi:MAG: hypothetical protein PHD97_13315 [Bacteroidales bacterium]|nr:hypothetical protein [Bacteroidales bacterium]